MPQTPDFRLPGPTPPSRAASCFRVRGQRSSRIRQTLRGGRRTSRAGSDTRARPRRERRRLPINVGTHRESALSPRSPRSAENRSCFGRAALWLAINQDASLVAGWSPSEVARSGARTLSSSRADVTSWLLGETAVDDATPDDASGQVLPDMSASPGVALSRSPGSPLVGVATQGCDEISSLRWHLATTTPRGERDLDRVRVAARSGDRERDRAPLR